MIFTRRCLLAVCSTAVVCVATAAVYAFSADGSTEVDVPSPSAKADAVCRKLHSALPAKVDGLARHSVAPSSAFTAGWGDPTVVLRCGVAQPDVLNPRDHRHYDPTARAAEVNGVSWLVQPLVDDKGYRFTTTGREVFVEVTVPHSYAPEVNPLTDLAAAVGQAVPTTL